MRHSRLRFCYILGLALLLAACDLNPAPTTPAPGGTPTVASTLPTGPTARPVTPAPPTDTPPANIPKGGTLTVRIPRDVTTFNPLFMDRGPDQRDPVAAAVGGLLFSGLTRLDDRLRPQPDLATGWDVAPDGLSVVFHLRPNLQWSDGQPLTADDVIWTYSTTLAITTTTSTLQYHLRDTVLQIQKVDPPDTTVKFWLKKPYGPLLSDLSAPILPRHLLGNVPLAGLDNSTFSFQPIGSGPFMYSDHQPGVNIILAANPHYYGGEPHLSRVAFLVAPKDQVAVDALNSGDLAVAEIPQEAWQNYTRRPEGNRPALGQWLDPGYTFLAFNDRAGVALNDARVRQAWALALDKPALVREATGGAGVPIWGDIPPYSWAYTDTAHLNNDPARARQLLADAGWKDSNGDGIADHNGDPLALTIFVRADDPQRRRAAELMGPPLLAVGITTTVSPVDFDSVIQAKIDPGHTPPFDFRAMLMGWDKTVADPDNYALFHSSQVRSPANPNGLNYVGYASPDYDAAAFKARGSYDLAERTALYATVQQQLANDQPYYWLWSTPHYLALSPKLHGPINPNSPRYLWNVEQWWLSP
jgi:peptide/nickel transport system substrate-binding protein